MLLFITVALLNFAYGDVFKYISCYCLSFAFGWYPLKLFIQIHLMLLFIDIDGIEWCDECHSNTSHVIVYPYPDNTDTDTDKFKYISCYCLSPAGDPVCHIKQEFKYISCYCLSKVPGAAKYLNEDSNTSHVIVYRSPGGSFPPVSGIQIHLMLLFIPHKLRKTLGMNHSNTSHVIVYRDLDQRGGGADGAFKYISCYCLSTWRCPELVGTGIQIHLMLLFIKSLYGKERRRPVIQIHLMLLFIQYGAAA